MSISHSLSLATPSSAADVARELTDIAQSAGLLDTSVTPQHLLNR